MSTNHKGDKRMSVYELMFLLNEDQREELTKKLDTVLAVDIGKSFVKTNTGIKFPSNVYLGEKTCNSSLDSLQVTWKEKTYTVGDRSRPQNIILTDYNSDEYKICILTAIALGFEGEENIQVRLGLGLSPMYFRDHNEKLKEEIMKLNKQTISINIGEEIKNYSIEILEVRVFKQACTLPDKYLKRRD